MDSTAIDCLHDGITAADDILAKALRMSEVARIARLELQLRRYLLAKWNAHSRKAVREASALASQLKPAAQISNAIKSQMKIWAKEVLPRIKETQGRIYRLARIAGWKKANKRTSATLAYSTQNMTELISKNGEEFFSEIMPAFDIADTEAVDMLAEHQVFWIGENYDKNIGDTIANTTKETIAEVGRNRQLAGRLIRERIGASLGVFSTPTGWHGSAAQYFEGLAANAATTARAMGQLRSFQSYGITKYEWNAINDRRTCDQCAHLDGRVFTVEQGMEVMEQELQARTPEAVMRAHPFIPGGAGGLSMLQLLAPTPGRGPARESASLADANIAMPPLHFRCRCTVDVSVEAGSWEI